MSKTPSPAPRHIADSPLPPEESAPTDVTEQFEAWHEPGRSEATSELRPVPARRRRFDPATRVGGVMNANSGTWFGLLVVAVGFVLIFFSWSKVAGLVNVAQQVPYVVSGGLTGLALVIVGVTIVDVSVRRQDAYERLQQLRQISRTLADLQDLLEHDDDGWKA